MARKGGVDRGLFRREGCWWVRWVCPYGHEHKEKVGAAKGLARSFYEKRKLAVKTEGFCLTEAKAQREAEKPVLFGDVARRYLAWAERERPRSLVFRQCAMKHLVTAFGPKPLTDIDSEALEGYIESRKGEGAAPATINRERTVLGHLFTKARTWKLAALNPLADTDPLKEPDENPRPMTPDEEARLLSVLPTRYHAFTRFAIHTGLRLGELRAQTWKDTDLEQRTLTVTRPKSGKREVLPLNQTARRLLTSLERTGPLVFPDTPEGVSTRFVEYAKRAGLEGVTFHCLRDTFISRLAPHVSATTLMALARHRDLRTTRRYLKVEDAHLRAAVERLADPETDSGTGTQTGTKKMSVTQLLESIGL
jgi:integrase